MTTPRYLLEKIQTAPSDIAWKAIFEYAWEICSSPLTATSVSKEVIARDTALADLDLVLSSSGWELWHDFEQSVQQTSKALADWWAARSTGKAVLILDGLSLRELPWILDGAKERGFQVSARVTGAELPGDTTPFAKALGFGQRSDLENNRASRTHRLQGAQTDCVDLPWLDCLDLVGLEPNWVLWHQWPDSRIHDFADPGKGLATLATEAASKLTSPEFWDLIDRLTLERQLVITSDHGYAASGLFSDATEEQAKHLKTVFRSGRSSDDVTTTSSWFPPIDLVLTSQHGQKRFVLGRRKWKSAGGYPTLAHGGLSVLEIASPFIELLKPE
ncbi:hypothetical protein [Prochlorothrix hollandica]|uniref:Uncharacterized protein n=1 Tax=Prochlorothrix hollandica PCC 9006 = CALU 1027 TaxID=317619 RepID=A0A0M2PY93_PROHO|nr:hypothetical protein [Prochlorothrix hollandica]KKJ00053.1 hypothetical protein PROH_09845 [Prochlorothrix hollandica PCC 9006 = CALU 1027]